MPQTETTVLSQLAMNILGHNVGYYFVQVTTVMILSLHNWIHAFPMLASMSKDKYMPRMFNVRGDRLGYSNSIITLGICAMLLIIFSMVKLKILFLYMQ